MRGIKLLQTLLEKSCPKIHKKRIGCIFDVVESLLGCKKLWISALGRGIKNKTTAKHNIKKVDTLVGNRLLHADRHSNGEISRQGYSSSSKSIRGPFISL